MRTKTSWQDSLTHPDAGNHIVQVYQDETFLVATVTHFIMAGLQNGEAIIVVATRSHREAFISALEAQGTYTTSAKNQGQIRFFDAESVLSTFMVGATPEWEVFEKFIGSIIQDAHLKYKAVRAYGEMVNVLWQKGRLDAAIRVEEYWNRLAELEDFSLLCTYFLDPLSPDAYDGSLERICACHTHLIPADNYGLLETKVVAAMQNILGPSLTDMVGELAASRHKGTEMPAAQATLLFLGQKMPLSTRKILSHIQTSSAAVDTMA